MQPLDSSSNSHAVQIQDRRNLITSTYHWGWSLVHFMTRNWQHSRYERNERNWEKKDDNARILYVFIHGLRSERQRWTPYVEALDQKPGINYIALEVPRRADCGLKEAAHPFLLAIDEYLQQFPTTTHLCLVGASKGAQIAARIERKLQDKQFAIRTVSIAPCHQGSLIMSLIAKVPLFTWYFNFDSKTLRDLEYKGERTQKLIRKWLASTENAKGERSHAFYASSTDERVLPYHSGFVRISPNDTHHLFHGYNHGLLPLYISKKVLKDCETWHGKI